MPPSSRSLYASQAEHDADRALIRKYGYIFETPSVVLWGFPVNVADALECVPVKIRKYNRCDGWFVWLATGEMKSILALIPYRLPTIIFARDNKRLRVYDFEDLIKRI